MEAEWFPPRDLHTGDRSGFDMAAFLRLRSGERLLVSVEVKYVDTFSAKKLEYKGYTDYVNAAGLGQVACQDIVANGGSHFLRSVLLTAGTSPIGARRCWGGPPARRLIPGLRNGSPSWGAVSLRTSLVVG